MHCSDELPSSHTVVDERYHLFGPGVRPTSVVVSSPKLHASVPTWSTSTVPKTSTTQTTKSIAQRRARPLLRVMLLPVVDPPYSPMAKLSVESGQAENENEEEEDSSSFTRNKIGGKPLDERILDLIASIPDRTIRPGRLVAEFGLSVEDASAELCGLLAAVGAEATFRFERTTTSNSSNNINDNKNNTLTMVFTFPPDFAKRARRKRRHQTYRQVAWQTWLGVVHLLKIITALGLILSLLIVSIAAVAALMAAVVALSSQRGGNDRQRGALLHQVRLLFYSIRQLLWCYAVWGPTTTGGSDNNDEQDPFLREVAYDTALLCSVCCGNPGSIFYWMRMNQLQQRRHRLFRGWAGNRNRENGQDFGVPSSVPGVTLVRINSNNNSTSSSAVFAGGEHRGFLSVAVEFLFGPIPFAPGPTEPEKWVLRSAAVIQLSTNTGYTSSGLTASDTAGVTLEALAPYLDDPPASPHDTAKIVAQGLGIVAHFNGIPAAAAFPVESSNGVVVDDPRKARFVFPELMAESAFVATHYDYTTTTLDGDNGSWQAMLYTTDDAQMRRTPRVAAKCVPSYLKEERYRFTQLTLKQLLHCLALGTLNWLGVLWLHQSVAPGGILQLPPSTTSWFAALIRSGLLPTLHFYARLFFILPAGRLLLVMALNRRRHERNQRRARLVGGLGEKISC